MPEASSVASARSGSASTPLQRLTVTVAADAVERFTTALSDLAPTGWCERPGTDGAAIDVWLPASDIVAPRRLAGQFAARGIVAKCGGPGNQLEEVRICFDREGKFRACGKNEDQRKACNAPRMYVPPVRG